METRNLDDQTGVARTVALAVERFTPFIRMPASDALQRGIEIAAIVAQTDPNPTTIVGALAASLIASGVLDLKTVGPALSAPELALVHGCLHLGHLEPQTRADMPVTTAQAESLRRMLLALVSDPRLVLVRIAEQLWLLRAARALDLATQQRLSAQTLRVYAPLANRLGLNALKWELEDYACRYQDPAGYRQIAALLNGRRAQRERDIQELIEQLHRALTRARITADVLGRPKHIYSILRKMSHKGLLFKDVYDIQGLRVLVQEVPECYGALGVVQSLWQFVGSEFEDYIAHPKVNGYQSIHTLVRDGKGALIEVQIRTHAMHERAELGVAAHWKYKDGGQHTRSVDDTIARLRALLSPLTTDDTLTALHGNLFAQQVYAVTPAGAVIELKSGATVLDFAYQVHTSLGHRCRGAKLNGQIVPLTTVLNNGDRVDILTHKEPKPSRDWLSAHKGYLVTKSARAKVRAYFRAKDHAQHARDGRVLCDRLLARQSDPALNVTALVKALALPDAEALYVSLGSGETSVAQVTAAIERQQAPIDAAPVINPLSSAPTSAEGISVMGVGDLLSTFARCCRPVPPEAIRGYLTVGRGITIHRANCGNLARIAQRQPTRVLPVDWGTAQLGLFPVEMVIHAADRKGLVRDVGALIADTGLSIERMSTDTNAPRGTASMRVATRVGSIESLARLIARIKALHGVYTVTRR
jgi:GTP pyrophosphokinase